MIPAGFVRDLRDRTDIVEVIEAHVRLRKAGRSFVGLCPFHQEKSPSFHVNRERQIFHCFGCQKGGDAITFLMEVEGLSFLDAVRDLAARAGVEVPEEFTRGRRPDADADARRDRWRGVMVDALGFFQKMLWSDPAGEPARRYLLERGCTREVAERFGLGFAPLSWDRLTGTLGAARHSPADLEAMGLAVPRAGGGHYDRFRGRLVFPVHDLRGQVIAFSGRILPGLEEARPDGSEAAKYINSPETPLYRKGKSFLGLPQARQAIRTARAVILVEGNFDLVAVHALGHPHVLAPLGTAFTPEQAVLLSRLGAETVTLLFDPDAAGQNAARKAFPVLAAGGAVVRWARLPEGRDPGSLLPRGEKDALAACLAEAPTFLDRALRDEVLAAGEAPESRAAAARRVASFIGAIVDMGERDEQVFRAAAALGIARHMMHREVETARAGAAAGADAPMPQDEAGAEPLQVRAPEAEALVIEAVLVHPSLARDAAADRVEEAFASNELRRVLQRLEALVIEGSSEGGIAADELLEGLDDAATRGWARGAILRAAEAGAEGAPERYARAVEAVRVAAEKRRAGPLGSRIRAAEAGGDHAGAVHLLEEKRRAVKGGVKKIIYGSGPRRRRAAAGAVPRGFGTEGGAGVPRGARHGAVGQR
ncbi:MAG: DNA primase [Deltaproteobacteria bacterium]|nr:DNA primase [Deltaproteobacteria bacterium]